MQQQQEKQEFNKNTKTKLTYVFINNMIVAT